MSSTVITGIGELVTCDGTSADLLGIRSNAALVIEEDVIAWIGPAAEAPAADTKIDVGGRVIIPGFVDSHSHLIFAGDRAAEFTARMTGQPYDGGGSGVTVAATRAASDDELTRLLATRIAEQRALGTTTVEIKSGYGLTVADEVRALAIARQFTTEATFLGAHVLPAEYANDRAAYVDLVTGPMLEAAAPYGRWIDVFCEPHSPHAFDADEARHILKAGAAVGLGLRVHGNQLGPGPGVQLAVELAAASVDHCTYLDDADVDALADAADTTVATLLPGVEFCTRSPYPDAARLLAAGVSIALATDCNPGTCYSSSVPWVISLAVREMGMTPAQALFAATAGSAKSLRRTDIGRLAVGNRADLTALDAPSYLHLAYRPGVPIAHALNLAASAETLAE
ncbi:MAG TPA: imidazolonepropionase [Propionibacteriaceae bacterium]|nr:imidazolonepropionase [Propionibacteriaceae bacterium]